MKITAFLSLRPLGEKMSIDMQKKAYNEEN